MIKDKEIDETIHKPTQKELENLFEECEEKHYVTLSKEELKEIFEENFTV